MKRKSILTIAGIFALSIGLASCGSSSSATTSAVTTTSVATSSVTTSSSVATSSPVVYTAMSISNKDDLTAEWHVGDANRQVSFDSTPAFNANALLQSGELVLSSSDADVVEVIGSYLAAKGAGTATVTATLGSLTDSVDITILAPNVEPDYKVATIDEVAAADDTSGTYAYVTEATVSKFKGTNTDGTAYGDFYLATGGDDIFVYGASASKSALAFSLSTMKYKFSNPKDFLTNDSTAGIKVNDVLDMIVIRSDYNGTKELYAVIRAVNGTPVSNAVMDTDDLQLEPTTSFYTYTVTGKITAWQSNKTDGTSCGNFYLATSGSSSDAVLVYGATTSTSALAINSTSYSWKLSNPKDFLTDAYTSTLAIGSEITMQVFVTQYNGTVEIEGIVQVPAAA